SGWPGSVWPWSSQERSRSSSCRRVGRLPLRDVDIAASRPGYLFGHHGPRPRMGAVKRALERLDRFQLSHRWTAFPFAVQKKFGDDRAGNLAALIAYYGFFSLFPLLLVFVSILGLVLRGDPALQHRIV